MSKNTQDGADNSMPKFIVRYWNPNKAAMQKRGYGTTRPPIPPAKFRRNYCAGRVTHVQSGVSIMFHTAGELLSFMEKHRYTDKKGE